MRRHAKLLLADMVMVGVQEALIADLLYALQAVRDRLEP
jgi:hypothetical protein